MRDPARIDIRVITATHRDIDAMIQSGDFREDLYYRLNGAQLRLPALRERVDKHFVIRQVFDELVAERSHETPPRLRADAISALLAYAWPGNIRQLKNALGFALATADSDEITVNDLPDQCLSQRITRQIAPSMPATPSTNTPPRRNHFLAYCANITGMSAL